MTINDKPQTAEDILKLALGTQAEKLNYWSNDGSPTWKSPLGIIKDIPYMGWKAFPNGCEKNPFFAVRKDAMDYVKDNAQFSSESKPDALGTQADYEADYEADWREAEKAYRENPSAATFADLHAARQALRRTTTQLP